MTPEIPFNTPPRNGEGDRAAQRRGGGAPRILEQPIKSVKRARQMRKAMSPPEVMLWQELRKRPGGYKFRRQFPLSGYYMDVACLSARLGIEIDGEGHDRGGQPEHDAVRDDRLRAQGFRMMRFPAVEVFRNIEGVLLSIVAGCQARGPLHHSPAASGPPPRAGEEK